MIDYDRKLADRNNKLVDRLNKKTRISFENQEFHGDEFDHMNE